MKPFITKHIRQIRESGSGTRIFNALRKLRLDGLALHIIHAGDIRRNKRFFNENSNRVNAVCSFLEDNVSREAFKAAVSFRQSFLSKNAPEYSKQQYFPDGIVNLSDNEMFIDCGAFNGDTARKFIEKCGGNFEKIVCFEPDAANFAALDRAFSDDERVETVHAGVWNTNTTLKFGGGQGAGSAFSNAEGGVVSVDVVAIDDVESCQEASFIKMDVEGAELNALKGAKKVIETNSPKLAISIYHSNEELLAIPEYLHSTLVDYSFYVRHHSLNWQDTVLYAIPL